MSDSIVNADAQNGVDRALADTLYNTFIGRVRTDTYITNTGRVDDRGHPVLALRALLDRDALLGHVSGNGPRVGTYLIEPGESTTRVAVLDFDSHKGETPWSEMVRVAGQVAETLLLFGLTANPFISSGGSGIHLIMIWEAPQDAYSVRQVLTEVLSACALTNGAGGVSKGQVEVFPKQDQVAPGRFGNQIWLPFANKSEPLDLDLGCGLGRAAGIGMIFQLSDPVPLYERPVREAHTDTVLGDENDRLRELLGYIDPEGMDYDEWFKIGLALHHETGGGPDGLSLWIDWSARSSKHDDSLMEYKWESMGQGSSGALVTGGTILKLARDAGWADLPGDDEFAQPPVVTGGDGGTLEPDLPRFDRWRLGPRVKYANRIDPELNALLLALETPEMAGGYLAYDDFLQATVRINGTAQRVDESMLGFIRADLESGRFPGAHFAPINSTALYDAANLVARRQRVDSAKAWAESLVWDGVPRVSSFYERHMHVREEDVENGYARAMSRYMWTAMAGRALLPGCKADTTPIWVDPRGGVGKSTLVAALSPQEDWVTGVHLGQLHNRKDALVRNMKGKLIGELSELRGLNTASAEDIKAFMTASVDDVHIMYSNDTGYFKRRIFFIGTTNEVDFISRMQGDRRLGPIMVGTDGRAIDVAAIVAEREQLWAEAVVLYKAHGVLWRDLTGMLAKAHEEFLTIDEWHQEIEKWLLGTTDQIMDGGEVGVRADREWTSSEILSGALVIPVNRQSRKDTARVNNIMRQLGFEQYMPRERNGKQVRKWRRIRRKN